MRINTKVRYALRLLAEIAKHSHGQPVTLKDIAQRQDLPKDYLSQLAAPLKNAGLLKSIWGNKGGYLLNRPPAEISLLEILEAVDGPVGLIDCILDAGACDHADFCECLGIWRNINEVIVKTLESYSLADLVTQSQPVSRAGDLCRIRSAQEEVSSAVLSDHRRRRLAADRKDRKREAHPLTKG